MKEFLIYAFFVFLVFAIFTQAIEMAAKRKERENDDHTDLDT